MRVAWFTPFSAQSAIGRSGSGIVAELAKAAEVEIWHADKKNVRDAGDVRTIRFGSGAGLADALRDYDVVAYNFGNHLPNHREIYLASRRVRGIAILHDFVMHHFFAAYYLQERKDPRGYVELMRRCYGERGRAAAEASACGRGPRLWESAEVTSYPLFEEAIRGAYGVVTHSGFLLEQVRRVYPGPAHKIPLAYEVDLNRPVTSRESLAIPPGHTLLLTVGHVNPNKRVEAVFRALGQLPEFTSKLTYALLGPGDAAHRAHLKKLARSLRLEGVVRFLDYAPDDLLHSYLAHADVCVNLRHPVTEGASASAIEAMWYGKPLIVTRAGFFGELPDDCALKIHPEHEVEDLQQALRQLLGDASIRRSMGVRAREHAQSLYRSSHYAREFLAFATEVRRAKPIYQIADRIAVELDRIGAVSGTGVVSSVAQECSGLFSGCGDESRD